MKLIIDISESTLIMLRESGVDWLDAEHILSAVAEGIPVPEREKGTPEEIINHAKVLKEYCDNQRDCHNCVFNNDDENRCLLFGDRLPSEWDLPEPYKAEKGGE